MTVSLSLWPEVESFINEKVKRGAYPSVNDAINDTLRMRKSDEDMHEAMMQTLTEAQRDELRREIQKGIDSHARGEYTEYDQEGLAGYADKVVAESKRRLEEKQTDGRPKIGAMDKTDDDIPAYVRPTVPPDWVFALKPRNPSTDGTNGLHRVISAWPGDETEEELLALERQIDDEDAGRI